MVDWVLLSERVKSRSQLASTLRRAIKHGQIPQGEPLPPEREMAQRLSLSRSMVRGAMEELEAAGLVECRQGSGRRVAPASNQPQSLGARTIAMVSHNPSVHDGMREKRDSDGHINACAANTLHGKRWHTLVVHPDEIISQGIDLLIQSQPAGVLVMNAAVFTHGSAIIPALKKAGIPHVVGIETPDTTRCDRVIHDHVSGSADLASALLERGHRRVLQVFMFREKRPWYVQRMEAHRRSSLASQQELLPWHAQRIEGYRRVMTEAGLAPLEPVFIAADDSRHLEINPEHLVKVFMGYLYEHLVGPEAVDAIIAITDLQAEQIAEASLRLGRDPRRDLDITGYDASFDPQHLAPALDGWTPFASIDKRNGLIGQAMVELLEKRIGSRDAHRSAEPFTQIMPHRLVDGRSMSSRPQQEVH